MRHRRLALGAVAAAAAALVALRRKGADRVELFYEDGSFVALSGDEAEPLLEIARSVLVAA